MQRFVFLLVTVLASSLHLPGFADSQSEQVLESPRSDLVWVAGMDVEAFWQRYADSKGGLTWGKTDTYPEYAKVKEGDTIWIETAQGPCLMEFFHRRWRRANDVRRWDDTINAYGGCPYVFD